MASENLGNFTRTVFFNIFRFALKQEQERRLGDSLLGDNYPAYASQWMAKAIAALSLEGYRLPGNEEWEIAAGELRGKRFLEREALAEVAVFGRTLEGGPTVVGTKRPNKYGLYDMLGLVWEWSQSEEVLLGGAFNLGGPEAVRDALFGGSRRLCYWVYINSGFRLFGPLPTGGGQAQDFPG